MRFLIPLIAVALLSSGCLTKRTVTTNGQVTEERVIVKGPLTQTVYAQ